MKKLLSLFLALALVFALFALTACSSDETEPSDSGTPTNAGTPGSDPTDDGGDQEDEYAWVTELYGEVPDPAFTAAQHEKLENGEITVGFCLEDLSQNFLVRMANGFVAFWEEKGAASGGVFSADGDVTVQATQIENCGTLGLDLICVASATVSSLANACEAVMAQGTMVIIRGEASVENCGFVPTGLETYPNFEFGWYLVDMVIAYMDEYNPGMESIKIATGELSVASQLIELFTGVRDRAALDDRVEIAYVQDWCLTIEDGYNTAEESLMFDPEIRAFLTFDEAPAIGFNNYIMGQPQLDPSEFICLATSASQESAELWELSKTNQAVMRGYVGGAWQDVSKVICDCSYKCLLGLVDTTGCYLEFGAPTPENAFGYELGDGGYMYS